VISYVTDQGESYDTPNIKVIYLTLQTHWIGYKM